MSKTINSTEINSLDAFFSIQMTYTELIASIPDIISKLEAQEKDNFLRIFQSASRSGYIMIYQAAPTKEHGQLNFAINIESHTDCKEITIHFTDFVDFFNSINFNQKREYYTLEGMHCVDPNYYVPVYSMWTYDPTEYAIEFI